MSEMNVTKRMVDSVAVITLTGDLDAEASGAMHADVLSVMPEHTEVLLDLSEVRSMSSAAIRALLLVYRHGQCLDSAVALVGLPAEVRAALSASGFLGFFRVADSVRDGIALLAGESGQGVPLYA
jgi:anti-sigma B factor antagonist